MMGAGFVQVKCPYCHVDQPARLSLAIEPTPDFNRDEVKVRLTADMRTVNQHVNTCARR
ncbi:MAG: hypothetical protein HOV92_25295 [Streptomyces sp.]|nr:hypothetical protein [Streptomyces sp.]